MFMDGATMQLMALLLMVVLSTIPNYSGTYIHGECVVAGLCGSVTIGTAADGIRLVNTVLLVGGAC